uniref:Uncharacterized protein n=1 Tax=viral metagenome TaxID=1070528 RepID=A0A6C0HXJ4_9ZZZZ
MGNSPSNLTTRKNRLKINEEYDQNLDRMERGEPLSDDAERGEPLHNDTESSSLIYYDTNAAALPPRPVFRTQSSHKNLSELSNYSISKEKQLPIDNRPIPPTQTPPSPGSPAPLIIKPPRNPDADDNNYVNLIGYEAAVFPSPDKLPPGTSHLEYANELNRQLLDPEIKKQLEFAHIEKFKSMPPVTRGLFGGKSRKGRTKKSKTKKGKTKKGRTKKNKTKKSKTKKSKRSRKN